MIDSADALERAAAGDGAAFEGFVREHEGPLLRYIGTLTSDPDRAEDALQETFIAAWRGAGSFRGEASARSWLFGIARNRVRREYRRPAGEPERFEPLDGIAVQAGWGRDPADAVPDRLAAAELVDRGFSALSPEDREILLLRDLEGFGNEDVAELLGMSLAAVKSRVHRARLRFMASLKEMER